MLFLFWIMGKMYFGFKKPKITILGSEFAGEIEAVGKNVERFKKGDRVFGYLGQRMGTYAEYIRMPEKGCVAIKPAALSFEEAAVVPYGAIMALSLLKKGKIQPGQKVLINGASGGIGAAATQLAKAHFGAEVTGVCGTPGMEYVKALGADKVIDYTREDFTQSGETYDLIFDILGKSRFSRCKRSLTPKGRYLLASFKTGRLFQMLRTSLFGGKRVICALAPGKVDDLIAVKELIEAGKIRAVIDRRYPMEQAAAAHAYVEQGHKKGNVVLTMEARR
jgi:NADPH:quinone reductase-like Zn-dependent oxidoreductase